MAVLKIPVTKDIRALRLLHVGVADVSCGTSSRAGERARWLLSLRDQQRERSAAAAALHALVASVTDALEATPALVRERLDQIAGIAVELGIGIAREVVGHALDSGAVDPTATVARCLRDCVHGSGSAGLTVCLHPEDQRIVESRLAEVDDMRERLGAVNFVADAGVERGAVRVETEAGQLVYEPRDVLERISAEVRSEVRA